MGSKEESSQMDNEGIVVHISGHDTAKRDQLVRLLAKTLRDQGYSLVELTEQDARDVLEVTDVSVLARVLAWSSELLAKTGALVLVSSNKSLSKAIVNFPGYQPAVELTTDEDFVTAASQRLYLTGEAAHLPEEITDVVLVLESTRISRRGSSPGQLADDAAYTAEEEALIEAHLRSLGYL
jgi:uncharacterized protein (DUF1330 family)